MSILVYLITSNQIVKQIQCILFDYKKSKTTLSFTFRTFVNLLYPEKRVLTNGVNIWLSGNKFLTKYTLPFIFLFE